MIEARARLARAGKVRAARLTDLAALGELSRLCQDRRRRRPARSACRSAARRSACSACSGCRWGRSGRTTCCTSTRRTAASPAWSASSASVRDEWTIVELDADRARPTPATSASGSSSTCCETPQARRRPLPRRVCRRTATSSCSCRPASRATARSASSTAPADRPLPEPWTDERARGCGIRAGGAARRAALLAPLRGATPAAGPAPGGSASPTGSARAATGACRARSLAPILRFADIEAFVQESPGGGRTAQLDGFLQIGVAKEDQPHYLRVLARPERRLPTSSTSGSGSSRRGRPRAAATTDHGVIAPVRTYESPLDRRLEEAGFGRRPVTLLMKETLVRVAEPALVRPASAKVEVRRGIRQTAAARRSTTSTRCSSRCRRRSSRPSTRCPNGGADRGRAGPRPPARGALPGREATLLEREITEEDIGYVVDHIGTFGDDNRAGIERTLHRISAIRNRNGKIVGLTCRIGRAVFGTIEIIEDFVETGKSILIMGRPGIGKTTMLREAARVLADDLGKRVVVVDTSNEIAGDGDIPHPAIGKARRMQVRTPSLQHEVMIEAVENHMPQVIVIDEIGTELEAQAARTIAERGVQLIGTAHGNNLDNLMLNPTLSDLIGGIQSVTLGDEEARRRRTQKSVLERKAPPTFDVVIEIQDRERVDGPRRRRRDGRRDAARRPGRARAALARRGGRPSLAGPAAAVTARAARRGAVRGPRRRRAGVAHRARLARRRRVPDRRLSRGRAGGGPARLPARRERRLAPDPRRLGPRAAPRGPSGGWLAAGTLPGARFAAARRGASRASPRTRRSSPARSPIAGRSSAAPATSPNPRPRRPRARPPAGVARAGRAGHRRPQGRRGDGPGQRRGPRGRRRRPDEAPPATRSRARRDASRARRAPLPTLRVVPQGISRKRLEQAIRELQLPVVIARDVDEADVVMTLRNEYRQKTPMLREAEERAMPIYVLKSNTILQMQASLTSIFALEVDPREAALRETEEAIGIGPARSEPVELSPRTPTSGASSTRWPSARTSSRAHAAASRTAGYGSIRKRPGAPGVEPTALVAG